VNVGELAVERRYRRAGQQIRGDHPRQLLEVAEMPPDGRQRGRDDGLVQRAQEHRQHDADDNRANFRMGERRRLALLCSLGL
jgi:hypothetical protein